MKTIHFQADGTTLTVSQEDRDGLVAGCHGYYTAQFDLSNDWTGLAIACEFTARDTVQYEPLRGMKCTIPDSICDSSSYKVRLIGKNKDRRLISTKVLIEQEGGGLNA